MFRIFEIFCTTQKVLSRDTNFCFSNYIWFFLLLIVDNFSEDVDTSKLKFRRVVFESLNFVD